MRYNTLLITVLVLFFISSLAQAQEEMKIIEGGKFIPLYGVEEAREVSIPSFYLDTYPVTQQDYLNFVKDNPRWYKSKVPSIYADERYLDRWPSDVSFISGQENYPIIHVSWFAAKNYCQSIGKRLPTTNEWEFVAMASRDKKDARADSLFSLKIIGGYEKPKTHLQDVGQDEPNIYGVHNMHGMTWEWTYDFNTIMMSGENRNNDSNNLFCGAGAIGASDLMDYAAFMRYAFRASIKARFSLTNLGFRCAKDK